jgi:tetratricopeptide (TPR) repeat protein
LGSAYAAAGNLKAAIEPWLKLKMIQPDNLELIFNIGLTLAPEDPGFTYALARLLATASKASLRDGDRTATIAATLFKSRPRDPVVMELMAVALAETGHFSDAIGLAERALELASENPALYRQGNPQRQKTPNQ